MKIIKTSITNIAPEFEILEWLLIGANYSIFIEAKLFSFEGHNKLFSIENLKELFNGDYEDEHVDGTIEIASFVETKKEIEIYLSYTQDPEAKKVYGHDWRIVSSDEQIKRKDFFWSTIKKHIPIPPKLCYRHFPAPGSFFYDSYFWKFTSIFINENRGLVIHIGACD